mmetsp:Transcript_26972/g.34994  ORF Transcript_26972/g.34994 Transcript_26972/m.34994 type:complete len:798 (+) Transcript_26972:29-2422(+)
MRRRNGPSNKVVPTGPYLAQNNAVSKIQAMYRGRKARDRLTLTKVNVISRLIPSMRMEVINLRNRVAHLEDSNNGTTPFKVKEDLNFKMEFEQSSMNEINYDDISDNEYALSGSMWDVVILLGTRSVGIAGTLYSTMLLIMNIIIQFIFCYIVLANFTTETFDDSTILGFRSWRRNIAHSSEFMEVSSEVSLASRICNNDSGLELSGSQAVSHQWLSSYLNGNGSLMCVLTVIMWLFTVLKEISSILSFWRAFCLLPRHKRTVLSVEGNSFDSISNIRYLVVMITTLCRFVVVASLGYAGTAWLTNTVSVTDLILNAVALEFILCVDELIFEALAPHRLKAVVVNFGSNPMPLPPVHDWKGVDYESISLFITLIIITVSVWQLMVIPFEYRLKLADDALCAGELDFVFTVGKTGVPAWSESLPYRDADGHKTNAQSYGTGDWTVKGHSLHKKDRERLGFGSSIIDKLVEGYGSTRVPESGLCGDSIFYEKANQTIPPPFCDSGVCEVSFCEAQYYVGLIDIYGNIVQSFSDDDWYCCISAQIKTPNIHGGRLSLLGFQTETVSNVMQIWNPGCSDVLGEILLDDEDQEFTILPFSNLFAGRIGDVLGGMCGICPYHLPYCDPVLNQCTKISCNLLEPYCLEDSTIGLHTRQFCPSTCSCSDPSNNLILTSSDYGCPNTCTDYMNYEEAVAEKSCEDEPIGSNLTIAYIDEVARISSDWPGFWRDQWSTVVYPYISTYGCDAIPVLVTNPTIPMDFCVEGNSFWPIKSMAYICPVSCACSTEMMTGCPSKCFINTTST